MKKYSKKMPIVKENILRAVDKINIVQGFKMGLDLAQSFKKEFLYEKTAKEEKSEKNKKGYELGKQ